MLCPFPCASVDPDARVDPYRLEHKAIRIMLGRLLESAGRADLGDAASLGDFRASLDKAVTVLQRHARSEVLFIDAVLAAHAPSAAAGVQHDHVELDDELTELVQEVEALGRDLRDVSAVRARGHAIYLRLTRFVASYLDHMAYEEEHVLALLHRYVSEIALRRALFAAQSHLPFEQRAMTYVHVLASVAPHERAALGASIGESPPAKPSSDASAPDEGTVELIERNRGA